MLFATAVSVSVCAASSSSFAYLLGEPAASCQHRHCGRLLQCARSAFTDVAFQHLLEPVHDGRRKRHISRGARQSRERRRGDKVYCSPSDPQVPNMASPRNAYQAKQTARRAANAGVIGTAKEGCHRSAIQPESNFALFETSVIHRSSILAKDNMHEPIHNKCRPLCYGSTAINITPQNQRSIALLVK